MLEFDPTPAADPGEHPTNLRRRGYNHLAFRVDDIGAVTEHLVANGVNMLSDEMDYISRRLRFFEGPEGITLELVQWVDAGGDRTVETRPPRSDVTTRTGRGWRRRPTC